jgi:hypothetical protein
MNNSLKFERSSMMLDNILNNQRSPFEKTELGYNPNTTLQKSKYEPKSYVTALKNLIQHDENTNEANYEKQDPTFLHRENEFRNMKPRRPTMNKYEYLFLGNCFSCNNFL